MTEFHINSDKEPSPETVELLAKVADQIRSGHRPYKYRWWRVRENLREYPPDKISIAGVVIAIAIFTWGLWSGEIRLW